MVFQSCVRACELIGYILEKDQNFAEAARNYEQAWRVGNRQNPKIGFRLAYSYLRNRQFVEAIEVCLQTV
ncbi:unnamed protein product [Dicrocoelium dendriticum]|nr:unnamed protein product [Dicrocoelium dendriticum]